MSTDEGKLTSERLHGTLLLDYKTVATAPQFFAVMALMLRSAGMEVHVFEEANAKYELGFRSAALRIPFHDVHYYNGKECPQAVKYAFAREQLLKGPVLWPDLDFGSWQSAYGAVAGVPGLTVLSWAKFLNDGGVPGAVKASA